MPASLSSPYQTTSTFPHPHASIALRFKLTSVPSDSCYGPVRTNLWSSSACLGESRESFIPFLPLSPLFKVVSTFIIFSNNRALQSDNPQKDTPLSAWKPPGLERLAPIPLLRLSWHQDHHCWRETHFLKKHYYWSDAIWSPAFLTLDLRDLTVRQHVGRAAQYTFWPLIISFQPPWINTLHSFLVIYTSCKRPRSGHGISSCPKVMICIIEHLDSNLDGKDKKIYDTSDWVDDK